MERVQGVRHRLLHRVNEGVRRQGLAQRGIIRFPLLLEVGGKIFVGIPVPIGSRHPALFAPEFLPECSQYADRLRHTVDALLSMLIFLNAHLLPVPAHHFPQRHVLVHGIITESPLEILLNQRECS